MSRCIYDVFNCNMEETTGESMPKGKRKFVPNLFFFSFFVNRFFFFLVGKIRKKEEGGRRRKETCRNFRMSFTFFFFSAQHILLSSYIQKAKEEAHCWKICWARHPPPQLKPRSLNTFKVVLAYRIQCLIISFFFLSKSNLKSLNLTLKKNFHLICDTHALHF